MKRTVSALLVTLLLLATAASATAAGKATVTKETFYVTPYYNGTFSGVLFGEITNTGDKAVAIDSGIYEFFDEAEEAVGSGSIYSFYPDILLPGEKAFFSVSKNIEKATKATDISDYSVTVVGKSTKEESVTLLTVSCSYEEYTNYANSRRTKLIATIENNTDALINTPYVVWAVYDKEGTLLYVDADSAYDVGVFPGSKIQLEGSIDEDIQSIMNTNGTEIGEVVAIAWCEQ